MVMTMTPEPIQWRASVHPSSPGWLEVPRGLNDGDADQWVEESLIALQSQWGGQWRPEDDQPSRQLLRNAALDRTDDKVLDLVYWPFARPVFVRVTVGLHPAIPLSSWLDEGFELDGFDNAELGPAVRCISEADTEVSGKTKRIITVHFVFDDGDRQVQVVVEPTFIELYSQVAFEVVDLVGGLQVTRGDGHPFTPRPAPGYTLAEVDTFSHTDDV